MPTILRVCLPCLPDDKPEEHPTYAPNLLDLRVFPLETSAVSPITAGKWLLPAR